MKENETQNQIAQDEQTTQIETIESAIESGEHKIRFEDVVDEALDFFEQLSDQGFEYLGSVLAFHGNVALYFATDGEPRMLRGYVSELWSFFDEIRATMSKSQAKKAVVDGSIGFVGDSLEERQKSFEKHISSYPNWNPSMKEGVFTIRFGNEVKRLPDGSYDEMLGLNVPKTILALGDKGAYSTLAYWAECLPRLGDAKLHSVVLSSDHIDLYFVGLPYGAYSFTHPMRQFYKLTAPLSRGIKSSQMIVRQALKTTAFALLSAEEVARELEDASGISTTKSLARHIGQRYVNNRYLALREAEVSATKTEVAE